MTSYYLGLSTSGHDPALAIVDPAGRVVFAEATERFVQHKRAWGIAPDYVPHLERALGQTAFDPDRDRLAVATSWATIKADMPVQISGAMLPATDGLWLRGLQQQATQAAGASLLRLGLAREMPAVMRFDHHLCHAVAACHQCAFDDAVCIVIDGEGEVGAASAFDLRNRRVARRWRSWGPGSLGTFYAWLTRECGFDWRSGEEWKVMGLAAFGRILPELAAQLATMLTVDDGRLLFADEAALEEARRYAATYSRLANDPVLKAADLAATGQAVFSQFADRVVSACGTDDTTNLILTGGCALNSSYNGTLAGRLGFDRVFVPSAPADDGNAIGAALLAWMSDTKADRIPFGGGAPYLGSPPNTKTVGRIAAGAGPLRVTDVSGRAASMVSDALTAGAIVGVMRGRAEFGPRALGHRSILADPRPQDMKDRINIRVKGRESYRPFAPIVPAKSAESWFDRSQPSPYMSFTLSWRQAQRQRVPAVVHEDGTGRLQTVTPESEPWLYETVEDFGRKTGVPIILNTSFNVMGKPIVDTVEDAIATLMTTGLDAVLVEDILIEK